MGTIIFIAICWYLVSGKNDPKVRRKMKGVVGTIPKLIAAFFLMIPASIALIVMAATFTGIFSAFGGFIPFVVIAAIVSSAIKSSKKTAEREKNTEYQEVKRTVNMGAGYKLSRSTGKRVRIISKFNKKYSLNLTDDQIERIMNASYVSYYWEREIYDMTRDYSVQAEWLNSDTDWLRAYLMAFPVMDIASDFSIQKNIVVSAFFQVFKGIQGKSYYSVDDMINEINNRYLVNFNEMTFRIAHRFLAQNGYQFNLPQIGIVRNESEIDRLAREYDKMDQYSGNTSGSYTDNGTANGPNIPLAR